MVQNVSELTKGIALSRIEAKTPELILKQYRENMEKLVDFIEESGGLEKTLTRIRTPLPITMAKLNRAVQNSSKALEERKACRKENAHAKEFALIQKEVAEAKKNLLKAKSRLKNYIDENSTLYEHERPELTKETVSKMLGDSMNHFDTCFQIAKKGEEYLAGYKDITEAQEEAKEAEQPTIPLPVA